jgi:hypothetical protein
MTPNVMKDRVGHIKLMQCNIAIPGLSTCLAEALRHNYEKDNEEEVPCCPAK